MVAGAVGIPELDGGVDVHHPIVVAPLQEILGADVPRHVDEQVARGEKLAEKPSEILLGHAITHEADALCRPLLQLSGTILEVHHRHVLWCDLEVLEQNRKRALCDGAIADEKDLVREFDHDLRAWWCVCFVVIRAPSPG